MAIKKYDSFFMFLSIVGFFLSFLCLIFINLPTETYNDREHTLSENLNNYYLQGKRWNFINGLFMMFTGIGFIGIIWLLELDYKMEYVYKKFRKLLKH
jgi:hypothetical protein